MTAKIGVLALQGAFIEHIKVLQDLGAETVELRQAADLLQPLAGLVLPGGERTVQGKLLPNMASSWRWPFIRSWTPLKAPLCMSTF